jgi:hypothetical protein
VAQGVGPEFKPQDHKNKQTNKQQITPLVQQRGSGSHIPDVPKALLFV